MRYYFSCPHCKSAEHFTKSKEERPNYGCLILLISGPLLLPLLLLADYQAQRIQCSQCHYIFSKPAIPRSFASIFAIWIWAIIILCLVTTFIFMSAGANDALPAYPSLLSLEDQIRESPRLVLYYILASIGLLLFITSIFSLIAASKTRKKYSSKFQIKIESTKNG